MFKLPLPFTMTFSPSLRPRRSRVALAAFALGCSCFPTSSGASDAKKLDEFFAQLAAAGEFNGNVLVAEGGIVLLHAAYGLANEDTRAQLEPGTPHRIASVTKGFTAVLALQAAERGEINLDDAMLAHIPEVDRASLAGITLRHLLTHTSGLADFAPDLRAGETLGAALARELANCHITAGPGASFAYVNANYTIISHILERATQRPYAELLRERILDPAGMSATYLDVGEDVGRSRAMGYELKDGALARNEEPDLARFLGAGSIVSTTEDLHRFSRALAADTLLSAASRHLMQTPQQGRYAFGCAIMKTPTGEIAQLLVGNMPGTSAVLARLNDGQHTIILLSNRSNAPLNRLVPQVHRLLATTAP